MLVESTTKQCTKCHRVKPIEDFHNCSRNKDGKHHYCKLCLNAYNKKTSYQRRISWLYGVSKEQYAEMLKRHNKRCGICRQKPKKGEKRLGIDHDHSTGRIRGLLCQRCNLGLAWYEEGKRGSVWLGWFNRHLSAIENYLDGGK